MSFLLCGTLALLLPLLGVALDLCIWPKSPLADYRAVVLAVPLAVLVVAHFVVLIAAAVGAIAFAFWIWKMRNSHDGPGDREPAAQAEGDLLCLFHSVAMVY